MKRKIEKKINESLTFKNEKIEYIKIKRNEKIEKKRRLK